MPFPRLYTTLGKEPQESDFSNPEMTLSPVPPESDPLRQQAAKDKLYWEGYREGRELSNPVEFDAEGNPRLRSAEELQAMDALDEPSIMDEYIEKNDPKQWGRLKAIHDIKEQNDPMNYIGLGSPMRMLGKVPQILPPKPNVVSKAKQALPGVEEKLALPQPKTNLALPAAEKRLELPAPRNPFEQVPFDEIPETESKLFTPAIEKIFVENYPAMPKGENRFVVPGLYSEAESAIANRMKDVATPAEITEILSKAKPSEIKFLQIPEFLSGKEKVTKQELMDHIQDRLNQFSTSNFLDAFNYETVNPSQNYNMSGLTFDPIYDSKLVQSYITGLNKKYNDTIKSIGDNNPNFKDELAANLLLKANNNLDFPQMLLIGDTSLKTPIRASREIFQRPMHYNDVPNVIGHTRRNIVEDPKRGRLYQLEEAQSDFHQQGSKHGYRKLPEIGSKEFFEELNAPEEIERLKMSEEKLEQDIRNIEKEMDNVGDLQKLYKAKNIAMYDSNIPESEVDKIEEQIQKIYNSDAYIQLKEQAESLDKQQQELRSKRFELKKHLKTINAQVSDEVPFRGEKISEVLFKKALYEAAKEGADEFQWTTPRTQVERYPSEKNAPKLESVYVIKNADNTYDIHGNNINENPVIFENVKEEHLRSILPEPLLKRVKTEKPEVVGGETIWEFETPNYIHTADKTIVPDPTMYLGGGKFREIYGKTGPQFIKKFAKEYGAEPQIIEDLLDPTAFSSLKLTPEMREAILKKGFPLFLLPLLFQNQSDMDQLDTSRPNNNRFLDTKGKLK